jgi:hypothetical protein
MQEGGLFPCCLDGRSHDLGGVGRVRRFDDSGIDLGRRHIARARAESRAIELGFRRSIALLPGSAVRRSQQACQQIGPAAITTVGLACGLEVCQQRLGHCITN